MGSFNKIGFVSNLPIQSGDKTVLVFCTSNKHRRGDSDAASVYCDDIFTPVLLPIFGEYDDYGKIEEVERDVNVKYIEAFFGVDIDYLIEAVDDRMVGRYNSDSYKVNKNEEIFKSLAFCLEHRLVYDNMASHKIQSWSHSEIGMYWLEKLGWQSAGETNDVRYKYKWIHTDIKDYYIACDGNWSHLMKTKDNKELRDFSIFGSNFWGMYHPYQLYHIMQKLNVSTNITQEDMDKCMLDISYDITGEYISEKMKSFAGDAISELRYLLSEPSRWIKGISSISEILSNNQYKLSKLITKIVSGNNQEVPELDVEELRLGLKENICDYIRFNSYLSAINGKYYPSNYGNQDISLDLHKKIHDVYNQIIKDKMEEYDEIMAEDEE